MPVAAIIGLGAAGIASSAIGAHAAGSAADAQVQAANHAADLQKQEADQSLAYQKQKDELTQKNLAPWLSGGSSAYANLLYQLGVDPASFATTPEPGVNPSGQPTNQSPVSQLRQNLQFNGGNGRLDGRFSPEDVGRTGNPLLARPAVGTAGGSTPMLSSLINPALGARGSLLAPFNEQFKAPTDVTEKNDPGYKFRLAEGDKALQRSAAARGGLLTGGTAAREGQYAQDYASNEYGNVYNRAFNEFSDRYNIFKQNQTDIYNRLASVSGVGQTTASTLGTLGQNSANNVSNILMNSGQQIGQDYQNAGAATASGYIGGANALSGGLNNLSQLPWLYSMMNQGSGVPWANLGQGIG